MGQPQEDTALDKLFLTQLVRCFDSTRSCRTGSVGCEDGYIPVSIFPVSADAILCDAIYLVVMVQASNRPFFLCVLHSILC